MSKFIYKIYRKLQNSQSVRFNLWLNERVHVASKCLDLNWLPIEKKVNQRVNNIVFQCLWTNYPILYYSLLMECVITTIEVLKTKISSHEIYVFGYIFHSAT